MYVIIFFNHVLPLMISFYDGDTTLLPKDVEKIIPSEGDRNFLKEIGQKESIIISYVTGKTLTFTGELTWKGE